MVMFELFDAWNVSVVTAVAVESVVVAAVVPVDVPVWLLGTRRRPKSPRAGAQTVQRPGRGASCGKRQGHGPGDDGAPDPAALALVVLKRSHASFVGNQAIASIC